MGVPSDGKAEQLLDLYWDAELSAKRLFLITHESFSQLLQHGLVSLAYMDVLIFDSDVPESSGLVRDYAFEEAGRKLPTAVFFTEVKVDACQRLRDQCEALHVGVLRVESIVLAVKRALEEVEKIHCHERKITERNAHLAMLYEIGFEVYSLASFLVKEVDAAEAAPTSTLERPQYHFVAQRTLLDSQRKVLTNPTGGTATLWNAMYLTQGFTTGLTLIWQEVIKVFRKRAKVLAKCYLREYKDVRNAIKAL